MTIPVRTLEDAETYQIRLIQRVKNSGKATEEDLGSMEHILDIIQGRIKYKREKEIKS